MHNKKHDLQSTKSLSLKAYHEEIQNNIKRLQITDPYSTTSLHTLLEKDINDDTFPSAPKPNKKTHDVAYAIMEKIKHNLGYMNLVEGRKDYKLQQTTALKT